MSQLEALRERIPEYARDLKLNLQAVLQPGAGALSPAQSFGVAIASAAASRQPELRDALIAAARAEGVAGAVLDDAGAAAALMAMNNIYYRFRHQVGKPAYGDKPARLRMNRLARPASNRVDLELYCLAVSAIHGCEACVRAHEQAVLAAGLSEDQVHDAVRIAATIHGVALALDGVACVTAA
jgi:alkyl hydroperoxide reductase subunit D